ncbi:MAG: hypothetical protein R3Y56_02510 [Akkermansia sp.]
MQLKEELELAQTRQLTDHFNDEDGRRPRLLLASLGETADERALRLYAAAYADAGFDIDVCPLKQSPADTARMAAENDVHAIGLCGLQAAELPLVADIHAELSKLERADIPCFVRVPAGAELPACKALAQFPADNHDNYRGEAHHIIEQLSAYYL